MALLILSLAIFSPVLAMRQLHVNSSTSTTWISQPGCIYVGILTGLKNHKRRELLRNAFLKELGNQDPNDAHRVVAEFVIGHGDFPTSAQGVKATKETQEVENALITESNVHGDIRRVPLLDDYKRLTDKVFQIMQIGVQRECSLIVKLDDDMSLDMAVAKRITASLKPKSLLYTGKYLWRKQGYEIQKGADGRFVKYFGGPAYALSRELAAQIVQDPNFAGEFLTYGSKSEDVDMGRWVSARDKPAGTVKYLEDPNFAVEVRSLVPDKVGVKPHKQSVRSNLSDLPVTIG